MTSKRSHHLIKLLMVVGVPIRQNQFIKISYAYNVTHRMIELLKNGATHLRDNGDVRFIFRLVLCSREDVSFSSICLNVLLGIKQFYLLMWFKKI